MLIKHRPDIRSSEITDRSFYFSRRDFIRGAAGMGLAGTVGVGLMLPAADSAAAARLSATRSDQYSTDEELTTRDAITTYNNYYEFGTNKEDPAQNSGKFKPKPWSVAIEGECAKPGSYTLEDIVGAHALEERVYRLRCVEAWSMVIPWIGFSLGDLLKRFEPNGNAKYVAFTTVMRPAEMPGQRRAVLDWPYREGLRIDEAMHPLAILATGLYGEELPNQNGAPLRLVVPWKYGFKSIKSIVKIEFTRKVPPTAWNLSNAGEYGFYSNVNPAVDHPRWSQRKERRIGEFLKRDTLSFNGYGAEVAGLYAGMDLRKSY